MSTDENIIYLNNPSIASEPTLSMDSTPVISFNHNGSLSPVDDEEGNYLPSDDATATSATPAGTKSWIKRNYLPLTLAFLVVSGVVFAAVVFRPGGPGNPTKLQINQIDASARGTDITVDDTMVLIRPTYTPTYAPTSGAEETEIEVPDTIVPTPTPITSFPTAAPVSSKPTFSPNFWNLFDPTPAPTGAPVTDIPTDKPVTGSPTMVPTVYVTGQVSETVSTEVTGPPTTAGREP